MATAECFINRRYFLKCGAAGGLGLLLLGDWLVRQPEPAHAVDSSSLVAQGLTADAALQKLLAGNQRFTQHNPLYPDQSQARLQEVAQGQYPFATILSCADSRVPTEIIFDQGVGDIFDVRVAGNIATSVVIGSIEYAVVQLGTPLLMVLGHERCGAVTAAVKHQMLSGQMNQFVQAILPALTDVDDTAADAVDQAVVANVHWQIQRLQQSSLLAERLQSGVLKLVGARYDLDTGKVVLLA
jgi:carbonic anhydrase